MTGENAARGLLARPVSGAPGDIVLFLESGAASACDDGTAVLDAAERTRAGHFRSAGDRARFVSAHVLLRRALSRVAPGVPPAAWRFDRPEPNGKPFAIGPDGNRGPEFSLTHCKGLTGLAVSKLRPVGFDAEPTHRPEITHDLAKGSFAPLELAAMPKAPDPAVLARLWCGKEALAKAVGQGLALDFAEIVIDPATGAVHACPPPLSRENWTLTFPAGPAGFTLALAWRR